ncbi:MAG: class I SAM-dependent methyltransferase [Gemmatimonadota bacterium]
MKEEYARARERNAPLVLRYQTRAMAAVRAYRGIHPSLAPNAVLELGSADGRTLLEIRRLFGERESYFGVELSPELLAHAPDDVEGVRFVLGDATRLPPEIVSRRYSLVTALALLEHLDDPLQCLRQARDVLEENGVMVASCPNPAWDDLAARFGLVRDEHHVQRMDADRMVALFERAGFRRVRFEPFMWLPAALLPYARIHVSPRAAIAVDALVRRLGRWTRPTFINQLVFGVR